MIVHNIKFISIVFLGINVFAYGQIIHHQALSSQGKGIKLSNGLYVSQIIGRQYIVGNFSKKEGANGKVFQKNLKKTDVENKKKPSITTINYPNPFINSINFQFSNSIEDVITVRIADVQGRLVFQQEKKANGNILTIELGHLNNSIYTIQLSALNFIYSAKIIKH